MLPVMEVPSIDFSTLQLLPYGVIVLDQSGTVLFYNAREQEISGREEASVLGKNFFTEVAPCTRVAEFFGRFQETVLEEGRTAEFKFHFPFPENPRDVDIALTGFVYREEHLCLVSVRDVTEEDQVRGRILNAERFADIGEIASSVAHNFNNTLMAINTWAAVIRRQLPSDHPAQKSAAQITRTIEDAKGMTSRIQDSLRATPGDFGEAQLVDLRDAISHAVAQVAGRLEKRCAAIHQQIRVETKLEESTRGVRGFSGELSEVFLNLLANGVDATSCAGSITVRSFSDGPRTVVEVTDSGSGMSPEVQRKLFRPLFTTKGKDGTGLGLSSAYATVNRHGGTIEVESSPGKGSTFRVILPTATN